VLGLLAQHINHISKTDRCIVYAFKYVFYIDNLYRKPILLHLVLMLLVVVVRNVILRGVTTRYGLLHYANLIRRTGPICFLFNLLNLATPLLSYAVRLVLLIFVPLSSLPCYLYDAILILTSDILYSLIDTFLSILRYINTHVFVVEP
jgi:hypothetical protein